jgi:multicomponent Na+:H+ antiporter subunit F
MTTWLVATMAVLATFPACAVICVRGSAADAVIGLELASVAATLAVLLLAEAFERQALVDLALTLAVMSFVGNLAYARFIEREGKPR